MTEADKRRAVQLQTQLIALMQKQATELNTYFPTWPQWAQGCENLKNLAPALDAITRAIP